jgi:hypothetical protein
VSKARTCDWCGEDIGANEARVRIPVTYDGEPFAYHVRCYCQVFPHECLRHIAADKDAWSGSDSIPNALRVLGAALAKR